MMSITITTPVWESVSINWMLISVDLLFVSRCQEGCVVSIYNWTLLKLREWEWSLRITFDLWIIRNNFPVTCNTSINTRRHVTIQLLRQRYISLNKSTNVTSRNINACVLEHFRAVGTSRKRSLVNRCSHTCELSITIRLVLSLAGFVKIVSFIDHGTPIVVR